jgi:hypothetical protein
MPILFSIIIVLDHSGWLTVNSDGAREGDDLTRNEFGLTVLSDLAHDFYRIVLLHFCSVKVGSWGGEAGPIISAFVRNFLAAIATSTASASSFACQILSKTSRNQ